MRGNEDYWRTVLWAYAHGVSGGSWKPYRYLKYISRKIQRGIQKGNARIIINIPPRYGKSELVSHWTPTWFLDWFSHKNVILTSYADPLARKWGGKVRDEFKSNPMTWTRIRGDKTSRSDWEISGGGGMRTSGAHGSIVGFGADLFIVDDPYKSMERAYSLEERERVQDWFQTTMYSRLEPGASVIVIMQRWHDDDLCGWLMRGSDQGGHEEDWEVISLPAMAEEGDPLGRKEGEPLCPQRYGLEDLERIKRAVGPTMWASAFQQRPAPREGGIFKYDWLKFWTDVPKVFDTKALSVDASFKKQGKSFAVCQAWGKVDDDKYLIDQWRERAGMVATENAINRMILEWEPDVVYIEDAANGVAIIDRLRTVLGDRLQPVAPVGSKEARAYAVENQFASGNVWLPHESAKSFSPKLVRETVLFPNAENDDQVDAMTQILNKWQMSRESEWIFV